MVNATASPADQSLTLDQRRQFLKLPLDERRRQMAEQAGRMVDHYESANEAETRVEWQGGDIVDRA